MPDQLKQLIDDVLEWPLDVQEKVIAAILAIQAEYIEDSASKLH